MPCPCNPPLGNRYHPRPEKAPEANRTWQVADALWRAAGALCQGWAVMSFARAPVHLPPRITKETHRVVDTWRQGRGPGALCAMLLLAAIQARLGPDWPVRGPPPPAPLCPRPLHVTILRHDPPPSHRR
jgi:hypothetical protein